MRKKPILLIIIFLFKKQIWSGFPIANNPSYQALASDAKNKSQNKSFYNKNLLERKKPIENSDTNKRKLEKEPKIKIASEELKNSQFDDIAYFIDSNFPKKILDDLYENCKKTKSEPQEIIVIGDNMDVEKDKHGKEDFPSVKNKKIKIETQNSVSGGNINNIKNRIYLNYKKFFLNSLSKQTTFFNYIELNIRQNTLLSKILFKFFKTSEAKNFLLAEQRNNSIMITTEKINKIINVKYDDFIAEFKVPKNYLRNSINGELSHDQQQFDNKTFIVLFLN